MTVHFEKKSRETARDRAYRILKRSIIMLELEPGAMVSENELAAKMNLSRTPVREALLELSKTRIVEIFPQKGNMIARINYGLVDESQFMRLVLESAVVQLACDTITPENISRLEAIIAKQQHYFDSDNIEMFMEWDNSFHKALFEICNKIHTYNTLDSMSIHFERIQRMGLTIMKNEHLLSDHRSILNAIKNANKEASAALISKHLTRYQEERSRIYERYYPYFI